jgi:Tfp pilus assembly protein PilP
MKSAQKGIEMKLIQILALATAMATEATAQNSGANSQPQPSPTPTPAAASKTGSTKPAAKKAASSQKKSDAKTAAGTPAKTSNSNATGPKADAAPKNGTAAPTKPTVKTSTAPVKPASPAGTQAKGAPTPVVAAKDGAKAATKKTDTKKADTKKAPPAKAPAVIAVKPVAPVKNAAGNQTKAAKPGVQVPAKAPAPGTAKKTPEAPAAQAAEKPKPSVRAFGAHGRRDPFVSPIVSKDGISRPAPNCTSGKRCLVIPELVLQGTVKDTSGKMMAVVANSIKKTYFLRENDQVFQGSVEKITSDSIIFREYVKDALGRETAREVVKKLVPPS